MLDEYIIWIWYYLHTCKIQFSSSKPLTAYNSTVVIIYDGLKR